MEAIYYHNGKLSKVSAFEYDSTRALGSMNFTNVRFKSRNFYIFIRFESNKIFLTLYTTNVK